jgi:hypothetical protein
MKLFFICVLATFSAIVNGQISISNLSLTDSTLPYFYIGVDNYIRISGKEFKEANSAIRVSGGGASILKESANRFIIRVNAITDDCRVWITNENGTTIAKKTFKVRIIPEAFATLNGKKNDTVSKKEILLSPFLKMIIPNCFLKLNYQITSFSVTLVSNGDHILIATKGNTLSLEQKKAIEKLQPSDTILFKEIRVGGPDDGFRYPLSFWIQIK